jgi:hypothetical protein
MARFAGANLLVTGVFDGTARVPGDHPLHALEPLKDRFYTPEAACTESRLFFHIVYAFTRLRLYALKNT